MTDKGATTDTTQLRELLEVGTVDERAHRYVADHWTRYGDGQEIVEQREVWRTMGIVQRMALVMRDVEHVGKSGQNRDQNYSFRPIDEFMNALHLPLVKHEVVVTPKVLSRDSFERDRRNRQGEIIGITRVVELLVEFTFHSPDGSTLVAVTAGEGADVADKATNKAMAAALKYAIMQTFMVPTRELQDADAETVDVPSGSRQAHAQEAGAAATADVMLQQAEELGRDAIMNKLDDACNMLGKTRAELTKKWRDAHGIGKIAELDDPEKVPTVELYRYVLSLEPYVRQARERLAQEQPIGTSSATSNPAAMVLCQHTEGTATCTLQAGHDGDHKMWG